MARFS
ncbi:hypothetical protein LINPERPRIM_LOCUS14806 [Linum perenne]